MDPNTQNPTPPAPNIPPGIRELLSWDAPTVAIHERSTRWYLIAGAIAAITAVYAIATAAWIFAFTIALCVGMYALAYRMQPANRHISLTSVGVFFDGAFTRWEDCSGFWLMPGGRSIILHIARSNKRQGEIAIQLGGIEPNDIRLVLAPYLSEQTDKREELIDKIIRICKL